MSPQEPKSDQAYTLPILEQCQSLSSPGACRGHNQSSTIALLDAQECQQTADDAHCLFREEAPGLLRRAAT